MASEETATTAPPHPDYDTIEVNGSWGIPTPRLRVKGTRLQRAYRYRPWETGWGDKERTRWVDVPIVGEDASDDE